MIFELAKDFVAALAAMPAEHPKHRMLELLQEAIRRDIHFIDRHPTTLFQCMWNTCWWYDCPEGQRHYMTDMREVFARAIHGGLVEQPRLLVKVWMGRQPAADSDEAETFLNELMGWSELGFPWEPLRSGLHRLMEAWRKTKEEHTPRFLWLRSLRPPESNIGASLRMTLQGQGTTVACVAFSADGKRIASGSEAVVSVWDAETGQEICRFEGHDGLVSSVTWLPDGTHIAASCRDGTVRVWDAETLAAKQSIRADNRDIAAMACSPDGTRLAVAWTDGSILIREMQTGEILHHLRGHEGSVASVVWSRDSARLASTSRDCTVRIWEAGAGRQLFCFVEHEWPTCSAAFSPDCASVASSSADGSVLVWDPHNGQVLWRLAKYDSSILSLVFTAGGAVAGGTGDGSVLVWYLSPEGEHLRLSGHEGAVLGLDVSRDAQYLATASQDGTARIWGLSPIMPKRALRGHTGDISAIACSPGGGLVASGGGLDGRIEIWNATTGQEVSSLVSVLGERTAVEFLPGEKRMISRGPFDAELWDIQHGSLLGGALIGVLPIFPLRPKDVGIVQWLKELGVAWRSVRRHASGGRPEGVCRPDGWRLSITGLDTCVKAGNSGVPCAWHPSIVHGAVPLSDDGSWAWAVRNYLGLFRLEGGSSGGARRTTSAFDGPGACAPNVSRPIPPLPSIRVDASDFRRRLAVCSLAWLGGTALVGLPLAHMFMTPFEAPILGMLAANPIILIQVASFVMPSLPSKGALTAIYGIALLWPLAVAMLGAVFWPIDALWRTSSVEWATSSAGTLAAKAILVPALVALAGAAGATRTLWRVKYVLLPLGVFLSALPSLVYGVAFMVMLLYPAAVALPRLVTRLLRGIQQASGWRS